MISEEDVARVIMGVGDVQGDEAIEAARAILALVEADRAVPPGFKLVPIEPTEAMIAAGHDEIDWCRDGQDTRTPDGHDPAGGSTCREDLFGAYRAMLSVSPDPVEG